MSLKRETFRAVRWTTVSLVGSSILRFVQVMVLARLLPHQDFGVMAIVLSVTAFMQVFTDLGVSTAIIHFREISESELSSLYWLNVLVGTTLMLLLAGASPFIGGLVFHQPALTSILMLMSTNFVFLAAGQQLTVMAEKTLRFSVLAKIEITASLCACGTAIVWGWLAPSVYALVAGVLVNSFVQAALLWLFASRGWRPAMRLNLPEIARFLKFGAYLISADFINSLNRQADVLVAGRFFPAAVVGSYSLPRNLCMNVAGVTNPIVTRVGLPVMAQVQEDKAFLKSIYLKTLRMTASVNFPAYLALAVFARDVVLVVFGPKWISSAPLLVFLAMWGMFRSCGNPSGSLVYAVGRANLAFWWNAAQLCILPISWVAAHYGIRGLAAGQVLFMAGLLLPTWYFLIRPTCGAQIGEYIMAFLSPLGTALFAILLAHWAVAGLTVPLWRLAGMALVAIPTYVLASAVTNRTWLVAMQQLILRRSQA